MKLPSILGRTFGEVIRIVVHLGVFSSGATIGQACRRASRRQADDACHSLGYWRRFGRMRDGGASVRGAAQQSVVAGSRSRLPTGPDAGRHPRYVLRQRPDERELFLEEPEGAPPSG